MILRSHKRSLIVFSRVGVLRLKIQFLVAFLFEKKIDEKPFILFHEDYTIKTDYNFLLIIALTAFTRNNE